MCKARKTKGAAKVGMRAYLMREYLVEGPRGQQGELLSLVCQGALEDQEGAPKGVAQQLLPHITIRRDDNRRTVVAPRKVDSSYSSTAACPSSASAPPSPTSTSQSGGGGEGGLKQLRKAVRKEQLPVRILAFAPAEQQQTLGGGGGGGGARARWYACRAVGVRKERVGVVRRVAPPRPRCPPRCPPHPLPTLPMLGGAPPRLDQPLPQVDQPRAKGRAAHIQIGEEGELREDLV